MGVGMPQRPSGFGGAIDGICPSALGICRSASEFGSAIDGICPSDRRNLSQRVGICPSALGICPSAGRSVHSRSSGPAWIDGGRAVVVPDYDALGKQSR